MMRIRKARHAKNLRQEDVAEKMNINLREYQRLERNSSGKNFNPTLFTLRALYHALELDPGDLLAEPSTEDIQELSKPHEPRADRR